MSKPTHFEPLLELARARRLLPPPRERRRIREDAGLSLRQLADAVGCSHTAVALWESGRTPRQHRRAYAELLRALDDALREEP